jgi:hypothetical protein
MPSSSEGPTCCICLDIYDQELARAFTGSCGHSICAQCEFKLRIACIKKGIPSQCWICMKPFEGPLYRTYALESATPRTEKARFPNPYMTSSQLRQQLTMNPELYKDIHLPNYTPPDPELPETFSRHQIPSHPLPLIQRQMMRLPLSDSMYPPTYSGNYANLNNNNNVNRHHPYRPMTAINHRINPSMTCYPSQQQQQQYPSNPPPRCPPPQYHPQQQQSPHPQFFPYNFDTINSLTMPPSNVLPQTPAAYATQFHQMWQQQQQQQQQQQNNNANTYSNNYGNYQ